MTAIRTKVDLRRYLRLLEVCKGCPQGGHAHPPFHVDKRGIVTQQRNRISGDMLFASDGSAANTSTRDICENSGGLS